MKLQELKAILQNHSNKQPRFILPDGKAIPSHFHITEVGHVKKEFVDCGGTLRTSESCVLQAWVASDEEHRLEAGKLNHILNLAGKILPSEDLEVEVEYEGNLISQFPITGVKTCGEELIFDLTTKHTDCLAKDSCGLEASTCCSEGEPCCS
jgi:hypothetical protein